MAIPRSKYKDISFGTLFNYLHVIKSGSVTMQPGTTIISLPEGYDVAFFRAFQMFPGADPDIQYGSSSLQPVGGYFNTGTDAKIIPDAGLALTYYSGGVVGVIYPDIVFYYFIYGGDYSGS